jgi:hypothetical protein
MLIVQIYNETIRDLLNFKKGPLTDAEKPVIHTQKVQSSTSCHQELTHPIGESIRGALEGRDRFDTSRNC